MGSRPRVPFAAIAIVALVCTGAGAAAKYQGRLVGCSSPDAPSADSGADDGAATASATATTPAPAPAPSQGSVEVDATSGYDPCSRKETVQLADGGSVTITLPCRPFDPVTDTPDPPPP